MNHNQAKVEIVLYGKKLSNVAKYAMLMGIIIPFFLACSTRMTIPPSTPTMISPTIPPTMTISLTEVPIAVPATFATVCDFDGMVNLQGFLHFPETALCLEDEGQVVCTIYINDPLSDLSIPAQIPMDVGMEDLGGHKMMVYFSSITDIWEQDMLQVTGIVQRSGGGDDSSAGCKLSDVSQVKKIKEFTLIDYDMPKLTLRDAIRQDWIVVKVIGDGLSKIDVQIEPKMDFNFELEIEPGTIFISQNSDVQNMVVLREAVIRIKPGGQAKLEADVSCANMEKKQPTNQDIFTVDTELAAQDLLKLLTLDDFLNTSFRIQQFAIWTITNNPAPDEYVSLSVAPGVAIGQAPSDEELAQIKQLLIRAGFDTSRYQAFVP